MFRRNEERTVHIGPCRYAPAIPGKNLHVASAGERRICDGARIVDDGIAEEDEGIIEYGALGVSNGNESSRRERRRYEHSHAVVFPRSNKCNSPSIVDGRISKSIKGGVIGIGNNGERPTVSHHYSLREIGSKRKKGNRTRRVNGRRTEESGYDAL